MMQSPTPVDSGVDAPDLLGASAERFPVTDNAPSSPGIGPYAELSAPGIQHSHKKETAPIPTEKEFAPETDGDKEVYVYPHDAKELPAGRDTSRSPSQKSRVCGLSRSWWLVLAAFVACTIGLAIALGVVFARKRSRGAGPNDAVGGVLNPRYYSTHGAFNGTGVALASANFGESATILLYYQDYAGDIKVSVLNEDGTLSAGSNTLTSDARNGTPISTVAYLSQGIASWHVFYLDRGGYVRQLVNTNQSSLEINFWQDGPLNKLNLKAKDADRVGLRACWWSHFYGDTDSLSTSSSAAANLSVNTAGIHLWYADTDTSFQQYSWYVGATEWSNDHHTWTNLNGHAGIGCQTWASGTTQYVFMADLDNNLSVFWKDSNSSNRSPNH